MRTKLTATRLRELLNYDPETGAFTNRITRSSRAQRGAASGSIGGNGYVEIRLDWTLYYGHRLAWLYMTGEWPEFEVDHWDTDRGNNRWTNLRDVSHQANIQNQRAAPRSSSTGLLGVSIPAKRCKPIATIVVNGKAKYLGSFDTPEQAHEAYVAAKRVHHAGCTL